jgi:methionine-S-sulfoxide reductase
MTAQTAYLAGGCFWGMEELVRAIPGVLETEVGYTGGSTTDARYEQVKTGKTGHAESLKVVFDPRQLSYRHLLFEFFRMHNPTTPNRQGNDIGTQYRSAIFYLNEEQLHTAEEVIKSVDASGEWQANGHDRSPTQTLMEQLATRLSHQKTIAKSPVIPRVAGEGSNESLREFNHNVVTEVVPFKEFYRAEEYHQKYLVKNRGGYTCHYVRNLDLGEGI